MTLPAAPLVLVAAGSGVILGGLAAGPLHLLGWANVLLWGVVNVGLGLIPGSRGEKVVRLAIFGFTVGFALMCFGYDGSATLVSRTPFFALIGVFCAVCAVLVGGLVHLARSRMARWS